MMNARNLVGALVVGILAPLTFAQTIGQSSLTELTLSEVTSFDYAESKYLIWASTRNESSKPSEWLFRYQPLFVPVAKRTTAGDVLNVYVQPYSRTGLWKTGFEILYSNEQARRTAAERIKALYPDKQNQIQLKNIDVLNIEKVTIEIPELAQFYPQSYIVDVNNPLNRKARTTFFYNNAGLPQREAIEIISPSKSVAEELRNFLGQYRASYVFTFGARNSTQNSYEFKLKELKNTKFYAALKGGGTSGFNPTSNQEVFVHRNDFRDLTDNILTNAEFKIIAEGDPASFELSLYNNLINIFGNQLNIDRTTQAKEALKSTFNGDDIAPDKVQTFVNKAFRKTSTEKFEKVTAAFNSSASAGFSFLKASASLSGNFSKESLQKALDEDNVDVEIKGNLIRVKSVDVQRVNLNLFNSERIVSGTVTRLSRLESRVGSGQTKPFDLVASRTGAISTYDTISDVQSRLASLERDKDGSNYKPIYSTTQLTGYMGGNPAGSGLPLKGGGKDFPIPTSIVPASAREFLAYIFVWSGKVNSNTSGRSYRVSSLGVDEKAIGEIYLSVLTYPQEAVSYNSQTVWLPVPKNTSRSIRVNLEGEDISDQNFGSGIIIMGYR
jgi:hypothetical protein